MHLPNGPECVNAVRWALDLGYRHIDTAQAYGNEESVGRALRDSGVPRDEVFITTKFLSSREDPVAEAEQSLRRLGLDWVDLYLVHWPNGGPVKAWPGMEQSRELGLARSIGISNFGLKEVETVIAAGTTPPAVNQVEFNPAHYRRALADGCWQQGVLPEAYSSLGTGQYLSDPTVKQVAERTGGRPRRCYCGGASRTISWSSPSRLTASGSVRTRSSSTSSCARRTWPSSTRSTRPKAPTVPSSASGGRLSARQPVALGGASFTAAPRPSPELGGC